MELGIIRWSIAGSTSNFKMNITHFVSVEVSVFSSGMRVWCVAHKRVDGPLKNYNVYLQYTVLKENLLSYIVENADWPYIFFHFSCPNHFILNMLWHCKCFIFYF